MEKKSKSVKLKLLNEHFQCGICQGYIIDATTISECLHSCKALLPREYSQQIEVELSF